MSYDLLLYQREFLHGALETSLGDWTKAPPIDDSALHNSIALLESHGFIHAPIDPKLEAFMVSQGHMPGRELNLDTPAHLAQFTVFPNSMAFSIPASPRSAASIDVCLNFARMVAKTFGLGLFDPQTGLVEFH